MNLASTISLYAGGAGSGCQGQNCGRKSWKKRYEDAGLKMPIINYIVKHKSQYEGDVNLELNTSHGQFFQRGENTRDAKEKFFGWHLNNELKKKGIQAEDDDTYYGPNTGGMGPSKALGDPE